MLGVIVAATVAILYLLWLVYLFIWGWTVRWQRMVQ